MDLIILFILIGILKWESFLNCYQKIQTCFDILLVSFETTDLKEKQLDWFYGKSLIWWIALLLRHPLMGSLMKIGKQLNFKQIIFLKWGKFWEKQSINMLRF